MPEGLAHPVVPGVQTLITLLGHALRHAGFMGNFVNQATIDKLPLKPAGQAMGEFRSLAAVLTFNSDDPDHGSVSLGVMLAPAD